MLHQILNKTEINILKKVIRLDVDWESLYPKLWKKLYNYYLTSGEMPYGVARARTGDPYSWITDRLERDLQ